VISVALGFVAWQHLREEPPRISKLFSLCPKRRRSLVAVLLLLPSPPTGSALRMRL
jgi:hypothetical protein